MRRLRLDPTRSRRRSGSSARPGSPPWPRRRGCPVNRATVHGHSDLNGVNRASCPCPKARREAFLGDVIARANAILRPPITTITVKAGDTLSEIAAAHKLTLKVLLAFPENAKYRTNPGLIHPGDIVRVK